MISEKKLSSMFIIAPPPTPNGSLHLGHMSGPYLAADIFKRMQVDNNSAVYCVSTDDNQTYVDTTAERMNICSVKLVEKSKSEIFEVLKAFSIDVDIFGEQDKEYEEYVTNFFFDLYHAGQIKLAEVEVAYDPENDTYPVESFISGVCQECFDVCSGGICETCGFPNNGTDLLNYKPTRLIKKSEPRLVIDLEDFRLDIEENLSEITMRPRLKVFVNKMLNGKLPTVVLSYKLNRGIKLDTIGLKGQVINVWAEMYPGHFYFLSKAASRISGDEKYVQFLGFDNSFFYVFLHQALQSAALRIKKAMPKVSEIYTNQFYNLGSYKFSTSKNHAIWAVDFAKKYNSDVIRYYLSKFGPEYSEQSFNLEHFLVEGNKFCDLINEIITSCELMRPDLALSNKKNKINLSLSTPENGHFSMREVAKECELKLIHLQRMIISGEITKEIVYSTLQELLYPIAPRFSLILKGEFDGRASDLHYYKLPKLVFEI
ncbi:UNVERIFIED_CONTAM: class I tRNA ligase family protein [Aeromonas hydrophila]